MSYVKRPLLNWIEQKFYDAYVVMTGDNTMKNLIPKRCIPKLNRNPKKKLNLEEREALYESDFGYLDRFSIEIDGAWHFTEPQAELDYPRHLEFLERGLLVIRFTGTQVKKDASGCVRQMLDIAELWTESVLHDYNRGYEDGLRMGRKLRDIEEEEKPRSKYLSLIRR